MKKLNKTFTVRVAAPPKYRLARKSIQKLLNYMFQRQTGHFIQILCDFYHDNESTGGPHSTNYGRGAS